MCLQARAYTSLSQGALFQARINCYHIYSMSCAINIAYIELTLHTSHSWHIISQFVYCIVISKISSVAIGKFLFLPRLLPHPTAFNPSKSCLTWHIQIERVSNYSNKIHFNTEICWNLNTIDSNYTIKCCHIVCTTTIKWSKCAHTDTPLYAEGFCNCSLSIGIFIDVIYLLQFVSDGLSFSLSFVI